MNSEQKLWLSSTVTHGGRSAPPQPSWMRGTQLLPLKTVSYYKHTLSAPNLQQTLWPQYSHNYGTTILWASERSLVCAKGQLCWEVTLGRGCFKKLPFMMEDGSSCVGKHRGAARKDFSCDLKVRTALNTVSVMRFPYWKHLGRAVIHLRTHEVKQGVKPNRKCWNENSFAQTPNKLCSLKKR